MSGVSMPDREYTNQCQLIVTAGDEATAQAGLEAAKTAIDAAIASLDPPVRLLTEVEDGRWVLSQA
jgi:hypothetical protein